MTDKLSRLVDVANAEYEYLTIKLCMQKICHKFTYDTNVYNFYLILYDYSKEFDVPWHYINRDILILGQVYAFNFPNQYDINIPFLISFYNIVSNTKIPSIQSFYIRVLFTKISIKYNIF